MIEPSGEGWATSSARRSKPYVARQLPCATAILLSFFARRLPTAMIFTPCEGGLSHNEAENVTLADIEPGVNVLFQAVLARAA